MTEPIHEIALTPDEVREIPALCGSRALLVGGQALALWVSVYEVTPPKVLAASISSDADFIGNAALARKLADALKGWDFWRPNLDDATPQTAKLSRTVEGGVKQFPAFQVLASVFRRYGTHVPSSFSENAIIFLGLSRRLIAASQGFPQGAFATRYAHGDR